MLVDGRAIAADIYKNITAQISNETLEAPHLTVFTCAPNFETQKYLNLKKSKANDAGIRVNVVEFTSEITTEEMIQSLASHADKTDGIIVQLPLPSHIDVDKVLNHIPFNKDVDVVHYEGSVNASKILPPVIGAIQEIVERHKLNLKGKKVVVVGAGKLVGKPAALWLSDQDVDLSIITKETIDGDMLLQKADVIITGAGDAGFITPDKVKEDVVIFDAGTSEEGGILKGDADPACVAKAALFTPVPGGIGPITVAILLRNLINLKLQNDAKEV